MPGILHPAVLALSGGASTAATTLSGVVTKEMVGGVFDEIVGLLPVLIPVSVGFIALRKGLGFLFGSLRQA